MKIDIKFIALLAIICLLSLSVASAADDTQADVTADANDDIEIGDADTATNDDAASNAKTLDEVLKGNKISAANNNGVADGDTIVLDKDYDVTNTICIDNKITLDGKGHTLDGKNSARIIAVRTSNVTLQNIVFENGFKTGDSGAAVIGMNGATKEFFSVKLINCTFINNKADYGSAFYTEVGGNEIINCTFKDNIATKTGGAIQINGNDNLIENCIFTNNKATATNGGAIAFAGTANNNNKIIGNTFTNNSANGAKSDGGALFIQKGSNNQIIGNTFTSNKAQHGGAVSLSESGHSTITNNIFTSNTATTLGGAARLNIKTSTTKTTISGNTFKSNTAPNSGALHIDGSNVEINKNTFDNNKATNGYAGSIQFNGNTLKILNNNISSSSATTNGGAIVVKTGTSMTIQSNNFNNVNANNGGAIHVESGTAKIDSNNFTKCSATTKGGAIKADTKITVTGNTFTDNTAKDKGSDVYIYKGAGSQVKNNNFTTSTANSLKNDDGSIVAQDNTGLKETVTLSTLNKNYAATTTTKYLTVVLKDSTGTGIGGKNITITLNGVTYTGVTKANGQFKTKIKLTTAKKYPCTVQFAGDDKYYAANPYKFTIAVNKAATKISSPAKTFKKSKTKKVVITLKSGKTLLKKQKVTIKINKKTYKGTTNNKGKATIKIKLTKKGTYKGVLKYATTAKYKACTGKVTIKVK